MLYSFNPHQHVKIWLSKKPDLFLNFENQKRLIKTRYKNPNDTIHFIYAESLLNDEAKHTLKNFCNEYNIIPVSIEKDILPECQTERETELAKWYQHEVQQMDSGGNPASASDLLRWLSPVYRRGTYSDFDVEVTTDPLVKFIQVDKPLLLNLGSMNVLLHNTNLLSFNNDIIAIVDEADALEHIAKVQDALIDAYTNRTNKFSYTSSTDALFKELTPFLPSFLISFMEQLLNSLSNAAKELNNIQENSAITHNSWLTPAQLREQLRNEKEDLPYIFAQRVLRAIGCDSQLLAEDNIISEVAKCYRQIIRHKTNWLGWLTLPSNQYIEFQKQISLSDIELYQLAIKEAYRSMYIQTVLNSTGPSLLLLALFGKLVHPLNFIKDEIAPFAFSQYHLGKYFDLKNGERIGASIFDGLARLFALEAPGEVGDISWVESGAQNQKAREENIKTKLSHLSETLSSSMQSLLDEMAQHRTKIYNQLNGSLGFYRNAARHSKIAALDDILQTVKNHQFDISTFYAKLKTYHSESIEAAFGTSNTKTLIDRCEKLCEQAIYCDIKKITILAPNNQKCICPN